MYSIFLDHSSFHMTQLESVIAAADNEHVVDAGGIRDGMEPALDTRSDLSCPLIGSLAEDEAGIPVFINL